MNFISNVLDAIPIVGHAKAGIHYLAGDTDGASNAFYQSTRTSAVLAGGAIGSIGGPITAAALAVEMGVLTDTAASFAAGEAQGFIKDCENIRSDIQHDRSLTRSLVTTGLHIGFDAVGGVGMGGLSSAVAENVGGKVVLNVGEEIIEKSVQLTTEELVKLTARTVSKTAAKKVVQKSVENAAETVTKITVQKSIALVSNHIASRGIFQLQEIAETSQSETNTATGSGSQPPRENNNNNRESGRYIERDDFSIFLSLLRRCLAFFSAAENERISQIFENLSSQQKKYLEKIIKPLMKFGILNTILELVIKLFAQHFPSDVTFTNFLSLMEFVQTYINNEMVERNRIREITGASRSRVPFQERGVQLIIAITNESGVVRKIADIFNNLREEIKSEVAINPLSPDFRDIFSAVYHYFKHRIVPGDGIFTVRRYYKWIRDILDKVKNLKEFSDLTNPQHRRKVIVYELYLDAFGRRIKIVVKCQGKNIVLSSCFVVNTLYDGDENGDVIINGVRRT